MKVLVTGAAGYIGSHVARALEEGGHEVVRLDDLSTGHEANLAGRPCVRARVGDRDAVARILPGVTAVAHLAGSALVPESVARPEKYWRNNVVEGLALLETLLASDVRDFVFSSTCAVYGVPQVVPIGEDASIQPLTPYGASKAAFERILADLAAAHGLRPVVLRFFNAAGAHQDGDIGEIHDPETHLIPLVLEALAGRRPEVVVHGEGYATPDGTCVRDYVDVRDIARAHVLALEGLAAGRVGPATFNLGHGSGHGVREVIRACEHVTGRTATVRTGPSRPGDPPVLVARTQAALKGLGWTPEHDLEAMVRTAWRHAQGRKAKLG